METTKKRFTIIRTRNSQYSRYRSNIKSLFVRRYGLPLEYRGQHENAEVLAKRALTYAQIVGDGLEYELRTGTGIAVERGEICAIAERIKDHGKTS